jgi:hypothetical protein
MATRVSAAASRSRQVALLERVADTALELGQIHSSRSIAAGERDQFTTNGIVTLLCLPPASRTSSTSEYSPCASWGSFSS